MEIFIDGTRYLPETCFSTAAIPFNILIYNARLEKRET